MSALSNGRLRALLAIACISFLLLYHYRTQELEIVAQRISSDLLKCQEQTESIMARLQLMYEHKELASNLLSRERRDTETKREEFEARVRRCEFESVRIKKDLNNCQADPNAFNSPKTSAPPLKQAELFLLKEKEVLQLKENLEQLQHVLEEKTLEMEKMKKENENLQITIDGCENKLSLQAAGHPKGPYYVQNETVHFAREHKAGQGLEFNRDEIKFEPAKIVPARELVEKLKRRKDDAEIHPNDRKQEDDYVNEKQNVEEKDYKEH